MLSKGLTSMHGLSVQPGVRPRAFGTTGPLRNPLSRSQTAPKRSAAKQRPTQAQAQRQSQKAANVAKKPVKAVEQTSLLQGLANAQGRLNDSEVSWKIFLGWGFVAGVTFGTFIQIAHNNPNLPVYNYFTFGIDLAQGKISAPYDVQNFSVGYVKQSGLVPFLLAPIWLLFPYLQVLADEYNADDPATIEANSDAKAGSAAWNLLMWGSIVTAFLLSGYVYLHGWAHWQCSAVLSLTAFANWKAFDNTKQGLFLAALLTLGAPATEMFIVNVLQLWHYDRPDLLGVPHWCGWCYAQYATGTGNFGRYLWKKLKA